MSFHEDHPETLRDPRAMRALAHPVRLAVLEILDEEGPKTATEISEYIGESPANTAFHLRTLAKYGYVEDAGGGTGRSRPWRSKPGTLYIDESELTGEAHRAAVAMQSSLREQTYRRIECWANERSSYPEPWNKVGFESSFSSRLTAEELKEIGAKVGEVLAPYMRSEYPEGAQKVTITTFAFPTVPPSA